MENLTIKIALCYFLISGSDNGLLTNKSPTCIGRKSLKDPNIYIQTNKVHVVGFLARVWCHVVI